MLLRGLAAVGIEQAAVRTGNLVPRRGRLLAVGAGLRCVRAGL
ncbi:hypothetical protein [Streptomyces sp. NPDC048442]